MGLLDRLFGRGRSATADAEMMESGSDGSLEDVCTHKALAPRWEDPDDMGVDDKATSWYCQSCDTSFTPAEAAELRAGSSA